MAWTGRTKPEVDPSHLLKEDSDFLLLEDGSKIVTTYGAGDWSTRTKPS